MTSWNRALDAAGITGPALRRDYTRQREAVARFRRSASIAVRLLLPGRLVPHVIAATAFMHHGDNMLDSGPPQERESSYAAWEKEVRDALATGRSDHPVLRPLLHTVAAHPGHRARIEEYLDTARTDLDFSGFATAADYQRYVDGYSLPAFMVVAGLLAPAGDPEGYRAACRVYIDGSQQLDFANDLAEDLADGRLNVPLDALERHGVTREDLAAARDLPGTRALIAELLDGAERALAAGRALVDTTPEVSRPLVRALVGIDELTARAARAKGAGLLRSGAEPPTPAVLRLLGREYLRARRTTAG